MNNLCEVRKVRAKAVRKGCKGCKLLAERIKQICFTMPHYSRLDVFYAVMPA